MADTKPSAAQRAVDAYNNARDELLDFLADEEIRDVLMELEQLINQHNIQLDNALRAVKTEVRQSDKKKLIIDGLGAQKKYKKYYDTDFLANSLPADQADEVLTERVVYDVDKARLEQLVRQGEVDGNIVAAAYHEDEQNPASLPGTPKPYYMPTIPVAE